MGLWMECIAEESVYRTAYHPRLSGKYLQESLDDDADFYKQALKSWMSLKPVPEIPQIEEFVDIYEQWLIEMLHHDIQDAFHNMINDPDKESLRRLITDYRDKLQHIYIDEES